jgi:hypothetical protein
MSVYLRRFGFDPGEEVLLEIESVNVLDLDPPAAISGVGTGTVICVGEFENGPFAATSGVTAMPKQVYEVSGSTDFTASSGSFGYNYAGVSSNNPCARGRKADSATSFEDWNGNAFVQLSGKKFRRLLICRVDTSVGSVEFKRTAYLESETPAFTYNLEPAQTLVVVDAGTTRTATFSAAAATVNSGSGTYPNGFVGGETLTLGYDAADDFTVTFLAGDTTKAAVISRINTAAGFTFATDGGGDIITLTGITRGTTGEVRVVSGSTGVLTALSMSAADTAGTGNVQTIDSVTFEEIRTIVELAYVAGDIKVTKDASGAIRLSKTYTSADDWMTVSASTTATDLGFVSGQHASNSGHAYVRSTAGTYPTSFSGGETMTLGFDDEANFTVVFGADTTQANVVDRINSFAGYTMARAISATVIELESYKNGGEVRVISASSGVFTALGFSATTATAEALSAVKIPAGTVVQNTGGTNKFVTMQDVSVSVDAISGVTASGAGPYSVKVRHANDDGTGTSASTGTLVALERAIDGGTFDVENTADVDAALSESAIDAAYVEAIDATKSTNSVAREANLIFSARQSNTIRKRLRVNAIDASGNGCFGRMACVRPPLNTAKATALSGSTAPGVGASRDQRVIYCYPGANTFVPLIAKRGLAGGAGFTADGNVDVGMDGFVASICSQLPPEENPGQETAFTAAINGLESGANVQDFEMSDYVQFRAKGIAALRMDDGVAVIQSGVTSVDPGVYPQLRNIARRRMADFIQDTLARRSKGYGKKLSTLRRRIALATEIRTWLDTLLSKNNPSAQRIAGWTVDSKSGNTPTSLGKGLYRLIIKVRTLASMDSIVLETTIGEQVTVEEQLPEAA